MKFILILFVLSNGLSIDANSNSDSTRLQRFINKTEIGVNFSYGYSLYKKGNVNSINAQGEYDKMTEWQTQNQGQVSSALYNHPNQLCYAFGGYSYLMIGLCIKSPFAIKKTNFSFLYGLSFLYEKSIANSSKELRMDIYRIHSDYLNTHGQSSLLDSYMMDTSTVRKIRYEYRLLIPLALSYNISKKFGLELGVFWTLDGCVKYKYVDYNGGISFDQRKIGTGMTFEPYLALNYQLWKLFEIQVGYLSRSVLFGSLRVKIKS